MLKKIKLGDLLVEHKIITPLQLDAALTKQKGTHQKLGKQLVELEFIGEKELLLFLSKQLNLPYMEFMHYKIKPEIIKELPEAVSRRFRAIPIDKINQGFLIAMADPTDLVAYDEISRRFHKKIRVVIARESEILRVIDQVYRSTDELSSLVGELEQEIGYHPTITEIDDIGSDAPIKKMLNSIFEDAVIANASDIHIEPLVDGIRIRQRVDGVLHEQIIKGKSIISALILRLKLMAKLNISEKRLPQDGRFTILVKEKKIDIRMATMPVQEGEAVVMRLLEQSKGMFHLAELGMPPNLMKIFQYQLTRPHGMILVTGPTGSGKSTTLYAGLSQLDATEKKIITVEDPVEYSFERINQVQVQPKIGLNFATILRSILRHDPDVIMVGEIRDEETAQIALRAAMTGHLVLSTLHTNDALSGPARLLDMGVEPYLAAGAIRLVISQRLVRRVCHSCREVYTLNEVDTQFIESMGLTLSQSATYVKAKGCAHCQMRGYKGRTGVYEFIEITNDMIDALRERDLRKFEFLAKERKNHRSLTQTTLDLASKGLISFDEVARLSFELTE